MQSQITDVTTAPSIRQFVIKHTNSHTVQAPVNESDRDITASSAIIPTLKLSSDASVAVTITLVAKQNGYNKKMLLCSTYIAHTFKLFVCKDNVFIHWNFAIIQSAFKATRTFDVDLIDCLRV